MKNNINHLKFLSLAALLAVSTTLFAQRRSFSDRFNNGSPAPSGGGIRPSVTARPPQETRLTPIQRPSRSFDNRNGFNHPTPRPYNPPAPSNNGSAYRGRPNNYRPPVSSSYRNNYNNNYRRNYNNRYYNQRARFYYGGAYHPHPYYYRPYTRPSFGIRFNILPAGYYSFMLGSSRYYFNDGMYYQPYGGYYQTVAPPYGAMVPVLPGGAVLVPIGGRNYYEYSGTYYAPGYDANGNQIYTVTGTDGILQQDRNDSGDIISDDSVQSNMDSNESLAELPSTFKAVTLDNKVYYVSPEGDYYVKVIDENGKATYQLTTQAKNQ